MKATVEEVNSVQKRVKVTCGVDEVTSAFNKAYQGIRRNAQIRGFRKGKAPIEMIKKLYGPSVASDVANDLIRDHLFKVISEEKLEPVAAPVLEFDKLPVEGNEYEFSAIVDLMPELKVNGYKGLKLEYKPFDTSAERVDEELANLQKRMAQKKPAEDGVVAAKGHNVTFSQQAFDEAGNEVPEMAADQIPVELGAEQLLTDIEDALLGMTKGETKEATVKLPEDMDHKELAGKSLKCQITLNDVAEMVLPELDDEFAKDIGAESLADLRADIEKQLEAEAKNRKRNQLEAAIFQQLESSNQFEVPPAIVDRVIDSMVEEANYGGNKDKLKSADASVRDRFREDARRRAKNTLILMDIVKQEGIEVTDQDVETHVRDILGQGRMPPNEDALARVMNSFSDRDRENLLFIRAVDWVIEQSDVKTV